MCCQSTNKFLLTYIRLELNLHVSEIRLLLHFDQGLPTRIRDRWTIAAKMQDIGLVIYIYIYI